MYRGDVQRFDGIVRSSSEKPGASSAARAFFPAIRVIVTVLVLGTGLDALAQPAAEHTVSGYVSDASNGEKLIGASLYEPALRVGATTNRYGFFSLTLPADSLQIVVSYIGFHSDTLSIRLNRDLRLDFALTPIPLELQTLDVQAERLDPIQEQTRMGVVDVPVSQIENAPALLGEVDLMKTMQLLPGVQSGAEGTSGLYVRGGGPDQNLILLDDAPVYNASHLFGFFSVFNSSAIKNVQLTKAGFPARFGGRLSSVMEVAMKDGNMQTFRSGRFHRPGRFSGNLAGSDTQEPNVIHHFGAADVYRSADPSLSGSRRAGRLFFLRHQCQSQPHPVAQKSCFS